MNALAQSLRARIHREGPIGVDQYMRAALLDPEGGYYTTRQPFGARGDFITAPGISQMFGEILGLWVADLWQRAGRPAPFGLVELGPGQGEMMADMVRAMAGIPGLTAALRPALVEASPRLRKQQQDRLAGRSVEWFGALEAVPEMPGVILANEFLDALPVRQFLRAGDGWCERRVGLDAEDQFAFVAGAPGALPDAELARAAETLPEGAVVEHGAEAAGVARAIAGRLVQSGGAALVTDYGYEERALRHAAGGGTLQAIGRKHYADPLRDPGMSDLTAHVNFTALQRAACAAGIRASAVIRQGRFLQRLGIDLRAAALARGQPAGTRDRIAAAHRRLVAEDGMGGLFRVLALVAPDWPWPEGLD